VAVALGVLALRHTNSGNIGPVSLAAALPSPLYVVLALLTASFLAVPPIAG
jgi:hypothetical protein